MRLWRWKESVRESKSLQLRKNVKESAQGIEKESKSKRESESEKTRERASERDYASARHIERVRKSKSANVYANEQEERPLISLHACSTTYPSCSKVCANVHVDTYA